VCNAYYEFRINGKGSLLSCIYFSMQDSCSHTTQLEDGEWDKSILPHLFASEILSLIDIKEQVFSEQLCFVTPIRYFCKCLRG